MTPHILKRKTVINENIETVFEFFSNAENLNKITPQSVGFKITSKLPIEIKIGAVIDYKIKLKGIPFTWQSLITKWEPPFLFEDTQVKGPYRVWIHEHRFEEKDDRTIMTDTVRYLSPGGIFEFIPHNIIVKNKVESIFDHRIKILNNLFPK